MSVVKNNCLYFSIAVVVHRPHNLWVTKEKMVRCTKKWYNDLFSM